MVEASIEKPVHYCYQCGNRLGMNLEACWYCGTPVHRHIRPLRRCPFCAEPIRREAVKCRHCGEFLDGRPHPDERPVRQMIVIDKDLLRAVSDLRLFPGVPVPNSARKVLEEETVRAIEDNAPDQIRQPGVRVLPAPAASPILIEWKPDRTAEADESRSLVKPTPQPLAQPIPPTAVSEGPEDVIDVETTDLYRICANCRTEILATDNFCYYCGTQYHPTLADKRRAAKARQRRFRQVVKFVLLLLFVGLVALGGYLYLSGYLTREKIAGKPQEILEEAKGRVAKGIEELKALDPRVIKAAEKCRENLSLIQSAKRVVAKMEGITTGTISLEDVLKELKMDQLPDCPSGGTYSLNPLDQMPTCSIGTNETASRLDDHVISDK